MFTTEHAAPKLYMAPMIPDRDTTSPDLLHGAFEAAAARTPHAVAVAVAASGETLSYGALDRRANQLAHHLRALGLQPRERVAVCLDRSPDRVLALLAVAKAGAAHVAIDPGHPADGVAFILADAGPSLVLTHLDIAARLHTDAIVLALDAAGEALDARPSTPLAASAGPDDPACVVYASATRAGGMPVVRPHRDMGVRAASDRVWPLDEGPRGAAPADAHARA